MNKMLLNLLDLSRIIKVFILLSIKGFIGSFTREKTIIKKRGNTEQGKS